MSVELHGRLERFQKRLTFNLETAFDRAGLLPPQAPLRVSAPARKKRPIPATANGRPRGGAAAAFRRLKVGQSVIVRGRVKTDGLHGYWKHLAPMRFSARVTSEGVRVWRIA